MIDIKRLYRLWRYDCAMNHFLHVWLYLWVLKVNTADAGDAAAFDVVDVLIVQMLKAREAL